MESKEERTDDDHDHDRFFLCQKPNPQEDFCGVCASEVYKKPLLSPFCAHALVCVQTKSLHSSEIRVVGREDINGASTNK